MRALRVLREVDLIVCEDTRQTGILLRHYSITTRMVSFNDHNKRRRTPELLEALRQGKRLALASDAGTPAISDPGFYLVRAAVEQGYTVIPIPGASALLSALVASGLPCDHFLFEGFLPRRDGKKTRRLQALASQPRTMVFFESSTRLSRTLQQMLYVFGDRQVVIARELTKKFEEFRRGRLSELIAGLPDRGLKGEITLVVAGCSERGAGQELP